MALVRFETLPRLVRQSAVAALGWRNSRTRFGAEYAVWRLLLEQTAGYNEDARQRWQQERLLSLLDLARSGTRRYARVLPERKALDGAAGLREVLDQVPLLEKSEMRQDAGAFENVAAKECSVTSTSGTTGAPMRFGHDRNSIQRRFALLHDHLRIAGIDPAAPSVRLSGRVLCKVGVRQSKPWLLNPFESQLFLSSYHLDDAHADVIWNRLKSFRPVLFDGYPSGIHETLKLLARHGDQLDSVAAIITTAETLHPELRDELARLSGAPVMDYYAASEGVPFIQQCPHGTYHVRWQSGIFEVRGDDGVSFSGSGELVCTSFVQDRTPLIRYCTGDLVEELSDSHVPCECGLSTQTVKRVLGRVEDLVYTPDGRALGMFTYRTLKHIDGLGDTQVVQHEYDEFEVNTVCRDGANVDALAESVKASFERALGYSISLRLTPMDQIPRGANGKVRLVISKVARRG